MPKQSRYVMIRIDEGMIQKMKIFDEEEDAIEAADKEAESSGLPLHSEEGSDLEIYVWDTQTNEAIYCPWDEEDED